MTWDVTCARWAEMVGRVRPALWSPPEVPRPPAPTEDPPPSGKPPDPR